MLKDRIRSVSAQPDRLHFVWQTHVYLENYRALGLPLRHCVALFGMRPGARPSGPLRKLCERFPEADIRLYEDTRDRTGRGYAPSIQPHLIVKALRDSPEWEGELTFFQDCDVAFRRLPDFDRMLREHPRACLLSDTLDYIGFAHLQERCENLRKEKPDVPADELIHRMCEVVGIDPELVRKNEAGSGGAQYLLQGVGIDYWQKVERDSVALRRLFDDYLGGLGLEKEPKDYLQVWTAGMWAYLWNLWLRGLETVVHPEMDFVFSGAVSKEKAPILHMAGLQDELKHARFDKQDWHELSPIDVVTRQPFVFDHFPDGTIAREYAVLIHDAAGVEPRFRSSLEPSRRWRLLVFKTDDGKPIWDVEHVGFQFGGAAQRLRPIHSGCARGLEPEQAFRKEAGYWGGRPERKPGCLSCLYLGVELDRDSLPEKITLTQVRGPHTARVALLQSSADGEAWHTVHVARLEPRIAEQVLFYRSDAGHRAPGWRVVARDTSQGFAWDVRRLAFLRNAREEAGSAIESGCAHPHDPSQYGPANALADDTSYWGGRSDEGGRFWIGIEGTGGLSVHRVLLEQGEHHFAERVEVEILGEDGRWTTFRTVDALGPGLNDILLFDAATPRGWAPPRLAPRRPDGDPEATP